jgi:hypothetical protein
MLRFRLLMIAAGHGDGNDAERLRHDPLFKFAPALATIRHSRPMVTGARICRVHQVTLRLSRAAAPRTKASSAAFAS